MKEEDSNGAEAEERIIRRIVQGETDQFNILVTRYLPQIHSMLARVTGDAEIANELSQDSMLKSYQSLKHFKFKSRFSTWLTRIALNNAHNYFSSRTFRDRNRSEPFDVEKHPVENSTNIDEEATEHEISRVQAFRTALSQIDQKYRDAIVLCSLEKRSYEEAAIILNIPVGTVRSRLNRARLILKDSIFSQIGRR